MSNTCPSRTALPLAAIALALSGCSSLGGTGPSTGAISSADAQDYAGATVRVVELDPRSVVLLGRLRAQDGFASQLGDAAPAALIVGPGDSLVVTVYEAPPALLFGSYTRMGSSSPTAAAPSEAANLPSVTVGSDGTIDLPFVGSVRAAGRTTSEIAAEVRRRLTGLANAPQVVVSRDANVSQTVTVLGETAANMRVPLTARGERLLDVLAAGDTLKQPVDKTTIQIARGSRVVSMPLRSVIANPEQNVRLQAGDVVTALYKPYSFTALGAVTQSQEVEFEATGLSLAQALGRVGGLDGQTANVNGVFVFRFEDPAILDGQPVADLPRDGAGRVPVIYRLDMKQAASLLMAQQFAMRDGDVLYVSKAPLVDLQKFVGVASQLVYTAINVKNGLNSN